jgi:2-polyprenyl-3-methyl-5-hydroxy-6-metoxy-1,4-benzoquinol methylase
MARIAPSRRIPPHQLNELEARMQAYYAAVPDYPAFHSPSHHPLEWRQVLAELCNRRTSQSPLAILEFGAGRSGFPSWLRQQLVLAGARASVAITCQDVTATNRIHLQQVADAVVISPLQEGVLPQCSFDIIFSTHCFEHVARPEQLLHTLTGLLKPGGSLLLFAPRYDLPLYLSPSAGDLSIPQRLLLSLRLLAIRLISRLRGTPVFVLDTKPACLDRPFRRDADAIHWVSSHDLHLFARRQGLAITQVSVSQHAPVLSKQWLIDQFCKLDIVLHKPESPRS